MNFQFLMDEKDVLDGDPSFVGGKAVGLAKLGVTGSKVPPWFVLNSLALDRHLTDAKLWPLFQSGFAKIRHANVDAPNARREIKSVAQELQTEIKKAKIPLIIVAEIKEKLMQLGNGPFAVRSSMSGEDSKSHSFAGQLESFLFQHTLNDVVESVRNCFASAFSERVLVYRLRSKEPLSLPRMGVVVQTMIDGEKSGVVFTAHPLTGERDKSLLTAAWGQGEGIVSGLCNTDEHVFDHATNKEDSHVVSDKDQAVVALPGKKSGTKVREVEKSQREIRCLSEEEVAQLGQETLKIANALNSPQDIEWTKKDGQFYMLQSRPITSLPSVENKSGPCIVFDNSNIQESYCGVTTPLTFTFAIRSYESAYTQVVRILALGDKTIKEMQPILANLLVFVRGRIYYNITNWYRKLLYLPSFKTNKGDMEKMMGLDEPVDFIEDKKLTFFQKLSRLPSLFRALVSLIRRFRTIDKDVESFLKGFEKIYDSVDRPALKNMGFSEILAQFQDIWKRALGQWHTPIVCDVYVMTSLGRLRRFIEKSKVEDPNTLLNNLLAGEEDIESTVPTRYLMGLAKEIRCDKELSKIVENEEPLEALSKIRNNYPDIAQKIAEYIERYGDRVMGELKLETVTLREDPSFLITVIRNYLPRPDLNPETLAVKEKRERAFAEKKLADAAGSLSRRKMDKLLKNARKAVKYRESTRLVRTRSFGLVRDLFLALGDRFVEAGKLEHRRDIFYLKVDELEDYNEGRSVCADLIGLVAVRKNEFEEYEKMDLPHRFETIGPVYHGNRYEGPTSENVDPDALVLKGTGCFPGIVESPVRVILDPNDELSVNGKILVTMRTDPGWAPLFPTTSGILVERGGTLSHSAVVARELGIPAIVGIPGLLQVISDEEHVRMNGDKGTVERIKTD